MNRAHDAIHSRRTYSGYTHGPRTTERAAIIFVFVTCSPVAATELERPGIKFLYWAGCDSVAQWLGRWTDCVAQWWFLFMPVAYQYSG